MTETDIRSQPFSLTKADYIAYYRSIYFQRFTHLPWGLLNGLFLIALPSCLAFFEITQQRYVTAAILVAGFLVIWVLLIPALGIWTMLRTLSKTANAYLPRTATVSVPNLVVEGHGFTNRQAWSGFRRVFPAKRLILLILTTGQAMIVPRSAFASSADCDAFITACRQHINGSRDRQARVFDAPMEAAPMPDSVESPSYRLGFGLFFMLSLLALFRAIVRPTTLIGLAAGMIGFPAWLQREQLANGDFSVLRHAAITITSFFALFPPVMALVNWMLVRKKPAMREPRRLAIAPDQLRLYSPGSDVTLDWPSIRRIDRRFGAIQFWVNWASSVAIPLSAFASPEDAQGFQDQAAAWWQAASKPNKT